MAEEFLRVSNIDKSYAGVRALDDVSMSIGQGEIHCLVGENGSGKSTLIKVIAGVVSPDEGQIFINRKEYKNLRPIDSIREGIQIIYQDFSLFPNLTVAENIALNYELSKKTRLVNWKSVHEIAQEALNSINIQMDLDAKVEKLSVANKQLIAIAKALLHNARLIIMDEPTTALTEREVKSLFEVIHHLQNEGISILFVSHKLNEVLAISEKIIVLRNGRKVAEGDASEFNHRKLVYHMTGREFEESRYDFGSDGGQAIPLLRVENLTSPGFFDDVTFELFRGEILGISGLLGSGRTDLALALFGLAPAKSGQIYLDGKPVRIDSIKDATRLGIGYVPEDRLTEGLFLEQSIGRNIISRNVDRLLGKLGLINTREMEEQISQSVIELAIKTPSPNLPVKSLSGGNQQRVVLAKWLASSPRLLILNGPTVGVDIGSKSEIHDILKDLARTGEMGLIVISDDIPELLQTCNRILLMRKGRIAEEFDGPRTTEAELTEKLTES